MKNESANVSPKIPFEKDLPVDTTFPYLKNLYTDLALKSGTPEKGINRRIFFSVFLFI